MFESNNDSFGNTFLKYNDSVINNVDNIFAEIEKLKNPNKGIIFLNFPDKIIVELNNKFYNNDIIYLINQNETNYHLLINNSSCPQFCDSIVRASGISIIVNHKGHNYALLMKDKTKKILTCIGGICTQFEYRSNSNYSINNAKRELMEETQGYFYKDNEKVYYNGLIINDDQLIHLAKVEFESTYYNLKVQDFYHSYGLYIGTNESDNTFFQALFSPQNELENGDYKLDYYENLETEYIYAIKLLDKVILQKDDFETTMNYIVDQTSNINLTDSKISNLHMFFNYLHLQRLNAISNMNHCISEREIFAKLKMHPSIRKIIF
ncbi:hypothetical protein QKC54_gp0993 [Megavirus baoshan]|uniref:Uncharacterized protein n=1 Tax=Megavirus baoshan TaxID=2496520 RepID=A0A3Q8U8D7_9VIRU|nr:hypothetical protein QKC54_gp0993 [Megavirus baoshan]AZL89656.1 hypothetical protein Mb0079 [Megavirus baoshan]